MIRRPPISPALSRPALSRPALSRPALSRPAPIATPNAHPIDKTTPPAQAAARLRAGESLIVTDAYGTGAAIVAELRSLMRPPLSDASYAVRHGFARTYRQTALRLLAPIKKHKLALANAVPIGFFAELYPELPDFTLPFIEVQELHGAWQQYLDGVHLTVLGHRVHPFYGTYAPTRVCHLELFATWLAQYEGPRERAVDVGTGCGVLALMLCKAGFAHVLATDINENAVESVARELKRRPGTPIEVRHGDLFAEDASDSALGRGPMDLVVFNPPWTKGPADGLVERALTFEEGLFERFFEQAHARLAPSGRLVMLFSNLIELVQPDLAHPIRAELQRGRFREVGLLTRKVKPSPGPTGKRRSTKEKVQVWELARV